MTGIKIINSDLTQANLEDSIIQKALIKKVNLFNSNFRGADIKEATLEETDFSHSDFRKVQTQGAVFKNIKAEEVLFYGKTPWDKSVIDMDWKAILPAYQDD